MRICPLRRGPLSAADSRAPAVAGVGYELGFAESINVPVLCLYRPSEGKRLSAMLSGNTTFTCNNYTALTDAYGMRCCETPSHCCTA